MVTRSKWFVAYLFVFVAGLIIFGLAHKANQGLPDHAYMSWSSGIALVLSILGLTIAFTNKLLKRDFRYSTVARIVAAILILWFSSGFLYLVLSQAL